MKNHIPSLNGLRAICILVVIAYHFQAHRLIFQNSTLKYASFFLFNGPLGVGVFFVISGFLITTLLIKEKEVSHNISLKNFYIRRTIRIFPAYYFLLFCYFVFQSLGYINLNRVDWLSSLTYTKQFFTNSSYQTSHLWSLSVEEMFYILWPVIFSKFSKYGTLITISLIVAVNVSRMMQYSYPMPTMTNTIFSRGDSLLIGCLFAIHYNKIVAFIAQKRYLLMLVFLLLLSSIYLSKYLYHLAPMPITNIKLRLINQQQPLFYSLLGNTGLITNLLIGLLIIISINIKSIWFKFLNLPIMEYIGKLSYSLYLWQQVFTADNSYLLKLPVVLLLACIFIAACLSYYLIEKPFLKLRSNFIRA